MKKTISIFMLIALIIACKHTILEPGSIGNSGGGTSGGGSTSTDSICFQTEILPMYQSYCASAGCHNSTSRADGIVLVDYTTIMQGIIPGNPTNSKYFKIITNNKMPPVGSPQLSSTQIALIQKWITLGALNNTCPTGCDTSKFTYATAVQTIFANSCNGCHGNAPGSGNVYLGTYAASQTYISANTTLFLKAINHDATLPAIQRMPQGTKMSDCNIKIITKWINAGMPK